MTADGTIRFRSRQLDGVIDLKRWREALEGVSDRISEVELVREAEAAMTGTRSLDGPGTIEVVMADAWDATCVNLGDIVGRGIDTLSSAFWFGLADCVRDVSRLLAMPDVGRGGTTVRDLLLAVAFVLDMAVRAADPAARGSIIPPKDARHQMARIAPIYVDLVVGRGVAWATVCELEAFCACAVEGHDPAETMAAYRAMRTGQLEQRAHDMLDVADPHTAAMLALLNALVVIDVRQMNVYNASARGKGLDLAGCLRQECLAICGRIITEGCSALAFDNTRDHGYCTILDVAPTDLVVSFEESYRADMTSVLDEAYANTEGNA